MTPLLVCASLLSLITNFKGDSELSVYQLRTKNTNCIMIVASHKNAECVLKTQNNKAIGILHFVPPVALFAALIRDCERKIKTLMKPHACAFPLPPSR